MQISKLRERGIKGSIQLKLIHVEFLNEDLLFFNSRCLEVIR